MLNCLDGLLYDLHIFVVPLSLLEPFDHARFLLQEGSDVFAVYFISVFLRCGLENLDNDLNEGLPKLFGDRLKDSAEVTPVPDFTDHSLAGLCVLKL